MAQAKTYTDSVNHYIADSIHRGRIHSGLFAACKGAGVNFNEAVDHIVSEINLNR